MQLPRLDTAMLLNYQLIYLFVSAGVHATSAAVAIASAVAVATACAVAAAAFAVASTTVAPAGELHSGAVPHCVSHCVSLNASHCVFHCVFLTVSLSLPHAARRLLSATSNTASSQSSSAQSAAGTFAAAACTTARSTSPTTTGVGAHRVDGDAEQHACDAIRAAVRRLGRGGVLVPAGRAVAGGLRVALHAVDADAWRAHYRRDAGCERWYDPLCVCHPSLDGLACVLPLTRYANGIGSRVAGMEGSYQPKSRTWTVEPLFSLEAVDDATSPFNLSLPQSATKTVRVLSTNSTSFTARVVGAAEDSRTTFQPVVRVLAGSVRPLLACFV
jgi:hypothetical protein